MCYCDVWCIQLNPNTTQFICRTNKSRLPESAKNLGIYGIFYSRESRWLGNLAVQEVMDNYILGKRLIDVRG